MFNKKQKEILESDIVNQIIKLIIDESNHNYFYGNPINMDINSVRFYLRFFIRRKNHYKEPIVYCTFLKDDAMEGYYILRISLSNSYCSIIVEVDENNHYNCEINNIDNDKYFRHLYLKLKYKYYCKKLYSYFQNAEMINIDACNIGG